MLRSALLQPILVTPCWGTLLLTLVLALPGYSAHAQSVENRLQEFLPTPQSTITFAQQESAPARVQQEIIPLAQPGDAGEIVVEEQGEGLISLKIRDASLKQVVAMIAESQHMNIIFSAPVDSKVTGSLIRVPWRQALETILASSGHTWTDDQGIMVVTTLEAAATIAPRAGGRRVETFELDFVKAVDVDQTVQGLLSPAGRSWVTQSSVTDNRQAREVVAVLDFPGNLAQIANYICQVDQPPRQVLIKAKILLIELEDTCNSGVNLQQLISFSGNEIALSTVGMANSAASPGSFLKVTGGSLDALVLQETRDAKSLASTELLVVSGQEARLQSGERIGYQGVIIGNPSGATQQSVEFLETGVELSVIPQVTRDGRVLMRVKPKVSEGFLIDGLPNEDTVEVETDVLLNNGQGLVIGGLIQEVDSNTQRKVPWLGDIPYAGILFQRRTLIKSRTEIIVTLIPHVLPYAPIEIAHNDCRMMRTQQPLLSPPLNRFPRPYEAQLPDTFTNPTPICRPPRYVTTPQVASAVVLEPDPSLEGLPPDAETGPKSLPPVGDFSVTPAPQQAARDFPTYH